MKRNISITMGMALVGVIAIIATLGLFSLNQATLVEAQAATQIAGHDPVTPEFEFDAPDALEVDDDIIINLEGFGGVGSVNEAVKIKLTAAGTVIEPTDLGVAGTADKITITLPSGADIEEGEAVEISLLAAASLTAPLKEGKHVASVDIDVGGTGGVDYTMVASQAFTVQNAVSAVLASVDPADEDVVTEVTVNFTTNATAGGLTGDQDTITITLEGFTVPSLIDKDHVTIAAGSGLQTPNGPGSQRKGGTTP
jgi:hypothetical protein